MAEHSPETQERNLKELLSALDIRSFQISFGMYLSSKPVTQHTLFFKSAALLSYLATRDSVEFNKLVQTLKREDLDNTFVVHVMKTWESLLRYDTDAQKALCGTCCTDLKGLMETVLASYLDSTESTLRQDIGPGGIGSSMPRDHVQDVKDCIFVVKNFLGN